ncbi:hypothetical protein [Tannockella kyphosi]|uniref:hypothetical protein n=1 Tax=Tannockella kyphosi TaxID=2899121 RepID=UPI00201175EF|nr:hypothetical protein [Tannockella kyphosi]
MKKEIKKVVKKEFEKNQKRQRKERLKVRTLKNLVDVYGSVYIHVKDKETKEHFIKQLDKESFSYGDGVLASDRRPDDIMSLYRDYKIGYLGYVGHMRFGCIVNQGNHSSTLCVEYDKYMNHEKFKSKPEKKK